MQGLARAVSKTPPLLRQHLTATSMFWRSLVVNHGHSHPPITTPLELPVHWFCNCTYMQHLIQLKSILLLVSPSIYKKPSTHHLQWNWNEDLIQEFCTQSNWFLKPRLSGMALSTETEASPTTPGASLGSDLNARSGHLEQT